MNCKIRVEDRTKVVDAYKKGESVLSLARQYGVGRQAIYEILWIAGITRELKTCICENCGTEFIEPYRQRKWKERVCNNDCGKELRSKGINKTALS